MRYAHLHTTSDFTFLTGASHPAEYVYRAHELGYDALVITDECSLAGVVKAFVAAEELNFKLIIGSRFRLSNGMDLIAIAPSRIAYAELSGFITLARRRAEKGSYEAHFEDLRFRLRSCLIIWIAKLNEAISEEVATELNNAFKGRLWIGINHQLHGGEQYDFERWQSLGAAQQIPLVACGEALMHSNDRKPLQDILSSIRNNTPVQHMGTQLQLNGEAYLKSLHQLATLYPQELLDETCVIADQCHFSMMELRYQYPRELVPGGLTPIQHLRNLVAQGKQQLWPEGVSQSTEDLLEKELALIEELEYEYYFLTVHDIVRFAREQNILCQGRGSAANSVVCYCLFVTEIAPGQISVLFERFISRERDEPPDIDVDFEHQRREEVIQYIYAKYGRERAAITAVVITYRSKSAVRDVGKALGLDETLLDHLTKNIAWWDRSSELQKNIESLGVKINNKLLTHFFNLVQQIHGFPRHLSQHTGGFVISESRISDLVPLENASMPDRTIIQWDKDDLEAMRLLKVDVLALGMLSALRRALESISTYEPSIRSMQDVPREDPETYEMLCRGDSVGVFQIESRAQMAMLPRLQPRCFYDLIIEIAIVRPGPIQGDMVHPYLRRRAGEEAITFPSEAIKDVLAPTLGVPIFQEQVMRLSMVAAGFTGGEADELRRAITNWGKNSKLLLFEDKFKNGLLSNGYTKQFADNLFEQVKGFGGYGFPESHSASFAILCYVSSWIKCHHPAAFYCSLLNSQPMGFYSPSQLIQDARRHGITVKPVNVNQSVYENSLELDENGNRGIRLGFISVRSLNAAEAKSIEVIRQEGPFISLPDFAKRTHLQSSAIEHLASADAFRELSGDRYRARWQASAVVPFSNLLDEGETKTDDLLMNGPTLEENVMEDYASIGLTLRKHPMEILRTEFPFNKCKRFADLPHLTHKGFVRIAGIVTGKQRPGTASGVLFMSLEDETGTSNVVIWNSTQQRFRTQILTGKLLIIKGTVEILTEGVSVPVIHVIAGHIENLTPRLRTLATKSRDFH
ncbi:error-prone DNA polymerase [Cellvibrio fibrivorans]|uniref:Error-prone DNA polymerase n=1 Tax=Cellvibrio fibrivorans TaxID=126350 RepID=A0ABU1UTX9_9GAMM|nr:error-prone DNA polymerase [Cellvibrio fibrivorans]MDR7088631.1 error-prone DNA polymerase [Cellvibrio fibrivorans]